MPLTGSRAFSLSFARFLCFQLSSLFGRANQLSSRNSNCEPNDHNLLCSTKSYQKNVILSIDFSNYSIILHSSNRTHIPVTKMMIATPHARLIHRESVLPPSTIFPLTLSVMSAPTGMLSRIPTAAPTATTAKYFTR